MSGELIGLITADEYLIDHIQPTVERLREQGFIWYGLLRSPAAADAALARGLHPLNLRDYVTPHYRARARKLVRRIRLDRPEQWSIAGVDFGKHYGYELDRYAHGRWADRRELRHMLEWSVCMVLAMLDILADVDPDVMVVWNGSQYPHSVYRAVAKATGVPTFYVERGYVPGSHVINAGGVNARAELPPMASLSEAQLDQTEQLIERIVAHGRSVVNRGAAFTRDEIRRHAGVRADQKLLLYPAQIDTDTNIILHSPVYRSNRQTIGDVLDVLGRRGGDYHLLIKPHPEDRVDRGPEFGRFIAGRGTLIDGVDLPSLLAGVDGVVVRNSTVGFEALLRRMGVITLADALYSAGGATFSARSPEQIDAALDQLASLDAGRHWRQKVLPMAHHVLSEYHAFYRPEVSPLTARCAAAQRVVEVARERADRPERRSDPSAPRGRLASYRSDRIERLGDQLNAAAGPLLIVDHSSALHAEPALKCLLERLNGSAVHLLTRPDWDEPLARPVRLFNRERNGDALKLLRHRYGTMVILARSRYLISRKVQLYTRLVRAGRKVVVDTSGDVCDYSGSAGSDA